MARTISRCPMPQPHQEGAGEPERNISVPQQGRQADAISGESVADYNLDIDYKRERSDSDIKS